MLLLIMEEVLIVDVAINTLLSILFSGTLWEATLYGTTSLCLSLA